MKARVYCLASAKGGSGKTVLCASFAAFLSDLGKKVLVVDVDAATNGLTLLYLSEVNSHRHSIAAAYAGRAPCGIFEPADFSWDIDVVRLPNGVSLIPATFAFSIKTTTSATSLRPALEKLIESARERFDFILLDAQAGADTYSRAAMSTDISHEVVIVSEYDPLSAAGIERMKALLAKELSYARTWILLNKMLPEFVSAFSEFLEVSKYLTPIPWDGDVVRACARRRIPLDLQHGNQFTLAVMQSLKRLLGEGSATEIEEWAEGRASSIREPIEQQYKDAERELKGLLEHKVFLERRSTAAKLRRVVPLAALAVAMSTTISGAALLREATPVSARSILVLLGCLAGMLPLVFLTWRGVGPRSAEREVEEARFSRRLSIVEDRLKKLEVLRNADLQTLVREGQTAR